MLGGFQFPVAAEIFVGDGRDPSKSSAQPGTLYALDLLGGCAGALLLSSYLIPVFGFWKTAWLIAAINLAPALLALRAGTRIVKFSTFDARLN
jgi:predicted membrane-bound spermidine synthase